MALIQSRSSGLGATDCFLLDYEEADIQGMMGYTQKESSTTTG